MQRCDSWLLVIRLILPSVFSHVYALSLSASPSRFSRPSQQKHVFTCSKQSSKTASTTQQTQQPAAASRLLVSV